MCRAFLSPYKDENDNYKFDGRFNWGVQTINIPQIALISKGDKELFWNILEISEPFRPSGEEYEEARKKREEAEAKLIAILPEGGVKIFEEFMEAVGDVEVLEEEEIYSQGFYFGLQLTTEAYTKNKNRVVKSIFE